MQITIEMFPEHYEEFLTKCIDVRLAEGDILKRGVIIKREIEEMVLQMVAIVCEEEEAHKLLALARALQSPAVEAIRRALDIEREL